MQRSGERCKPVRRYILIPIALLILLLGACTGRRPTPPPRPRPPRPPAAAQPLLGYDTDLCAWSRRPSSCARRASRRWRSFRRGWIITAKGRRSKKRSARAVAHPQGRKPYQKEFLAQWQLLGPHPRARAFWDGELKAVQLRADSFNDLINGLEKPEVETYKRGWERFAEAASWPRGGGDGTAPRCAVRCD